jgi:hypothetical protein
VSAHRERLDDIATSWISGAFMAPLGAGFYVLGGWGLVVTLAALSFVLGALTVAWLAWDEIRALKARLDPSKCGSSSHAETESAQRSPNPRRSP